MLKSCNYIFCPSIISTVNSIRKYGSTDVGMAPKKMAAIHFNDPGNILYIYYYDFE